ncbi:hypothetical protein [Stakelama pacifica]|nr:hypothetical protein [Stakelama pacifica]|tara:strand:- start:127 stop:459 length:333 start_codon:yes stop_codon:yes gene_type:complete
MVCHTRFSGRLLFGRVADFVDQGETMMKIIRTFMVSGAVAGMLASSAAMAAAPSAQASVTKASSNVRASTKLNKKSDIAGSAIIPLVIAAGIVAGGVIVATDDDDTPDSN